MTKEDLTSRFQYSVGTSLGSVKLSHNKKRNGVFQVLQVREKKLRLRGYQSLVSGLDEIIFTSKSL